MKLFRFVSISCIVLFATTHQIYSQSRFDIHMGPAFPLSKFGLYGINEFMSDPTTGINAGVKYAYLFSAKGIGAYAGIDFLFNGIRKEYKEEVEKYELPLRGDTPVYHAYYNLPFSTGICYDYRLNDKLLLSGNAGLTVNCLLISDTDLGIYEFITEPAFGLGGRIGAGLIIKDRVGIHLDYLGLGSHAVSGESISGISQTKEGFSKDLSIHLLTLTAGIVF